MDLIMLTLVNLAAQILFEGLLTEVAAGRKWEELAKQPGLALSSFDLAVQDGLYTFKFGLYGQSHNKLLLHYFCSHSFSTSKRINSSKLQSECLAPVDTLLKDMMFVILCCTPVISQ